MTMPTVRNTREHIELKKNQSRVTSLYTNGHDSETSSEIHVQSHPTDHIF